MEEPIYPCIIEA